MNPTQSKSTPKNTLSYSFLGSPRRGKETNGKDFVEREGHFGVEGKEVVCR